MESEIQRPSEWYVYLGKFVLCTNLPTIALLIIYMGKQLRNYADKKDKEEILTN